MTNAAPKRSTVGHLDPFIPDRSSRAVKIAGKANSRLGFQQTSSSTAADRRFWTAKERQQKVKKKTSSRAEKSRNSTHKIRPAQKIVIASDKRGGDQGSRLPLSQKSQFVPDATLCTNATGPSAGLLDLWERRCDLPFSSSFVGSEAFPFYPD